MVSFLTLYRGRTLEDAQLVAISTNDRIIKYFAERLLQEHDDDPDPALLGEGIVEVPRKLVLLVSRAPVVSVELVGQTTRLVSDVLEFGVEREVHPRTISSVQAPRSGRSG